MVNIFSRWNFQDVKSHQEDKNKTLIIRYLDPNTKGKQISSIEVSPEDITAKTQVMQINGINHDLNYDNVVSIEFAGKNKGDSSVISRGNLELKNDGK
jgi:hypothetical protein